MAVKINAVDEFNEGGHLIYADNYVGAFVRGKTRDEAVSKFPFEIEQYCRWLNSSVAKEDYSVEFVQQKQSALQICDADSDVLFDSEVTPLTFDEYQRLRFLVLKSAEDFETLYRSIPDKAKPLVAQRNTFYGAVPTTADEMYRHTKSVNSYYFGEIKVVADNERDIRTCRLHALNILETQADFLNNAVFVGSYQEKWCLRKVLRRFVWHDRIHAKAMYKAAVKAFGKDKIKNPFCFSV